MSDDSAARSGHFDATSAGTRRRLTQQMLSILTALRTLAIDVVIIGFAVGILWVTISDLRGDQIVIDEIAIPEEATKKGYSGQVASLRLWDAMQRIIDETAERTDYEGRTPLQTASQQLEITEPESGLSLRGLSQLVRKVFGIEQRRIAGEFVCKGLDCTSGPVTLRLRVFQDGRVHRIETPPIGNSWSEQDLDKYFEDAALQALRVVAPIVVAEYLNSKHDEAADEAAAAAIAADSANAARAATILVQFHSNRGNFEEAYRWKERIAELAAADERYWSGIASTILGWSHKNAYDSNTAELLFGEALDIFRGSLMGRPDDPIVLQWKGAALMGTGEYELASETFERFAEMKQDDPRALEAWGWSLYEFGDVEEAARKYDQALMISRTKEDVYLHWADTLLNVGRYEEAIERYEDANALKPGLRNAYYWLGFSRLMLNDVETADKDFGEHSEYSNLQVESVWVTALNQMIVGKNLEACSTTFDMVLPEIERVLARSRDKNVFEYIEANRPSCPSQ